MANKYQVDNIRRIVLERLESDWPQSLSDWRRLEAEIEVMEHDAWTHVEDPASMVSLHLDRSLAEPASAIRLAQECNIPSILPAAYYQLSRLTVEHDTASVEKDPESFVITHGIEQRTARWSLLEKEDLMRVFRGKVKLQEKFPSTLLPSCSSIFSETEDRDQLCPMHLERDKGVFIRSIWDKIEKASASDIFQGYQAVLKEIEQEKVCGNCLQRARAQLDCQGIWHELPSIFGLV